MTNEKYKPAAKCKYHRNCFLYNGNALRPEIETKLCGLGKIVDETYEPRVPTPSNFRPVKDFHSEQTSTCDAFSFYKADQLLVRLRKCFSPIVDELVKHHYW